MCHSVDGTFRVSEKRIRIAVSIMISGLNSFALGLLVVLMGAVEIVSINSKESLRPPLGLGAPSHLISTEHVTLDFYAAAEDGERTKTDLQHVLQNFLENLQRNLSTSLIFHPVMDRESNGSVVQRLFELADYFEHSSELAGQFANAAEHFFEITKNESDSLLLKVRQVPSAKHNLPMAVKLQLTDYFAEMEFFHVMFSEIIDEALEYIVDTLRSIQTVFIRYADIQREVLRTWNIKMEEGCLNAYTEFLQFWSAEIFKCTTTVNLNIAYDVYATTETTARYVVRQLEFRIQRLYNCFIFGSHTIRCQFLRYPEHDFESLFTKLDDLQQYYDIKIKKGRVMIHRFQRRQAVELPSEAIHQKCITPGFPDIHMKDTLKSCFNSLNTNLVV